MEGGNRLAELQKQLAQSRKQYFTNPAKLMREMRQKGNLDSAELKKLFYGEHVRYREYVFGVIEANKEVFRHAHLEEWSREEERQQLFEQVRFFHEQVREVITLDLYNKDPTAMSMIANALFIWNSSLAVKFGVHGGLYIRTIMNLGTKKHEDFIKSAEAVQDAGCFALTELGHGSNIRDLLTTAEYDEETREFVVNSNFDLGMKWWIGGAAETATVALVWAQLMLRGESHGIVPLIVRLRERETYRLSPGVFIGDCGAKNGVNGVDNGFIRFTNVRVPYDNMLDRFFQITPDHKFVSQVGDDSQRFAFQLGALSGSRAQIPNQTVQNAIMALTIAIRYSAVRLQFGSPDQPELPILEYPLTQHRLMPLLARTVVHFVGGWTLCKYFDSKVHALVEKQDLQFIEEMHALSSAMKARCTWSANQVIQTCREVLGGHGYSLYNRLGALYRDNDINTTWEGDNSVLLQQTAKFVVDAVQAKMKKSGGSKKSPKKQAFQHESVNYVTMDSVEGQHLDTDGGLEQLLQKPDLILSAFQWRVNSLAQQSISKLLENVGNHDDLFAAWNATQPYMLQDVALAYCDVYLARSFLEKLKAVEKANNKELLTKIFVLWGLHTIVGDLGTFREGDYITSQQAATFKEAIIELSKYLKDQSIALTDVLAPPDYILGAPMGASDGDVYSRYLSQVYEGKNSVRKTPLWVDIRSHQSRREKEVQAQNAQKK